MARPPTEAPEVRRGKILEAARGALVEKGYRDLRMSDVAGRAGVAAGTLYLYFKDKTDLVAAVFIDLFDRLEARMDRIPINGSPLKELHATIQEMLGFLDEHQDFLAQAPFPRRRLKGTAMGRKLKERLLQHVRYLGERLQAGVKGGHLRPHDPMLGGHYLMTLPRMLMIHQRTTGSEKPLATQTSELMDLLLHGLGAKR